mmetsp:Transcript_80986/g.203832  ORF Transcript_80986/g.203832 Transcript_80986/m.203832 type:complete len:217 (-) Transcript_80986:1061-1711(-)
MRLGVGVRQLLHQWDVGVDPPDLLRDLPAPLVLGWAHRILRPRPLLLGGERSSWKRGGGEAATATNNTWRSRSSAGSGYCGHVPSRIWNTSCALLYVLQDPHGRNDVQTRQRRNYGLKVDRLCHPHIVVQPSDLSPDLPSRIQSTVGRSSWHRHWHVAHGRHGRHGRLHGRLCPCSSRKHVPSRVFYILSLLLQVFQDRHCLPNVEDRQLLDDVVE